MANEAWHARFDAKVTKTDGCWLWAAGKTKAGYGELWIDGRVKAAHRLSYERHVGPIPEGLTLDHLCRVRSCVNPEHLEPVTLAANVLRGVSRSAANAKKTACLRGHPLSGQNVTVRRRADGRLSRRCRACHRLKCAEWRARTWRGSSPP